MSPLCILFRLNWSKQAQGSMRFVPMQRDLFFILYIIYLLFNIHVMSYTMGGGCINKVVYSSQLNSVGTEYMLL